MLTVYIDGEKNTVIENPEFLPLLAQELGIDVSRLSIPSDELAAYEANQARSKIRAEIEPVAGDTQSIQGTIADASGFLLKSLCELVAVMKNSNDAAVAAVAQNIADDMADFEAGLNDGSIKLTHMLKGTKPVLADAGKRATAAYGVFEDNAGDE